MTLITQRLKELSDRFYFIVIICFVASISAAYITVETKVYRKEELKCGKQQYH